MAVPAATPAKVDGLFRRLQLVSAAAFSLGHGGNDAQKTMGIISALLVGAGYLQLEPNGDLPVPLWVVFSAYAAISLGTLSGGWRIVKTLGQRITALKPVGGFSAETAAALSSTWPPSSASPSPPPRPSPAPSSGSARPAACRRSAGAWPARSSGRGS